MCIVYFSHLSSPTVSPSASSYLFFSISVFLGHILTNVDHYASYPFSLRIIYLLYSSIMSVSFSAYSLLFVSLPVFPKANLKLYASYSPLVSQSQEKHLSALSDKNKWWFLNKNKYFIFIQMIRGFKSASVNCWHSCSLNVIEQLVITIISTSYPTLLWFVSEKFRWTEYAISGLFSYRSKMGANNEENSFARWPICSSSVKWPIFTPSLLAGARNWKQLGSESGRNDKICKIKCAHDSADAGNFLPRPLKRLRLIPSVAPLLTFMSLSNAKSPVALTFMLSNGVILRVHRENDEIS